MHKHSSYRIWPAGHVFAASATLLLIGFAGLAALAQGPGTAPAGAQVMTPVAREPIFRAVSYEVYAALQPETQTLRGHATVEFEARQLSRDLEFELHSNLRISDARDAAGKVLQAERDDREDMLVRVTLNDPVPAGQRIKLTFDYAGPLANETNSPVSGMRLASIDRAGAYLLLPARWFPLTNYPSNRYTGTFHIQVPKEFVVAGTGTAEPPVPAETHPMPVSAATPPAESVSAAGGPPRLVRGGAASGAKAKPPAKSPAEPAAKSPEVARAALLPAGAMDYTFRVDRAEAAGSFVAGPLQTDSVRAEGVTVSVYAPAAAAASAKAYGEAAARMINTFSDQFGPLPRPNVTVAQLPDGTLPSFSGPGLLLLSQRQWAAGAAGINSRLLSNLVAAQWWSSEITAASPGDTWLTDGLSRYSEALDLEQSASHDAMNKALEDFAVGSLMYENVAPIAEAARLVPFSPDYTSVVVNKGALVFHMLREQMGDAAFFTLLKDYFKQFNGKSASLAQFEKMAVDRAAQISANSGSAAGAFVMRATTGADGTPVADASAADADPVAEKLNLRPFFAQWLHSTGVPEFTLNYTVYRTKAGFRIDGKVKQNLDFFRMPVELEIQTEGNPEYKTIMVSGIDSTFDLEVFGRPKPNGIILDPHNAILKSSQKLQVRAVIARGESLAEQGRYYDAIQQYARALDLQKNDSLALFRTGEAFFYQRNYSAAANSFRDSLDGDLDPMTKWVEVWSHLYLGKIYDIAGDRTRAVNEYSKAQQTNDDTGGALAEAKKYLAKPYVEGGT